MINWIKNLFRIKSRQELIEQELNRIDFEIEYLTINDQGKKFQKKCKIPNGNVFRKAQFSSWCNFMCEFTVAQNIYQKLLSNPNFNTKEIVEDAKIRIKEAALCVLD